MWGRVLFVVVVCCCCLFLLHRTPSSTILPQLLEGGCCYARSPQKIVHFTMQRIATFESSIGGVAGVNVLRLKVGPCR